MNQPVSPPDNPHEMVLYIEANHNNVDKTLFAITYDANDPDLTLLADIPYDYLLRKVEHTTTLGIISPADFWSTYNRPPPDLGMMEMYRLQYPDYRAVMLDTFPRPVKESDAQHET